MGKSTDHIMINIEKCVACGKCIEACPKEVLGKVNVIFHKHAHIDKTEQCVGCLKCVKACPQNAIISRRDLEKVDISPAIPNHRHRRHRQNLRTVK
ncbi:4Fe-4S dicluster domain-containing protein [Syntrophomonas curvata]